MNRLQTVRWALLLLPVGMLMLGACQSITTSATPTTNRRIIKLTPVVRDESDEAHGAKDITTATDESRVSGSTPETTNLSGEAGTVGEGEISTDENSIAESASPTEVSVRADDAAVSTPETGFEASQGDSGIGASSSNYSILASGAILPPEPLEPLGLVITQPDQLSQLLAMFPPGTTAATIDPRLVNENWVIVAIFAGVQGSGGHSVELQGIRIEGSQVVLEAIITALPPQTLVEPAEQVPYVVVLAERSAFPTDIGDVVVEIHKN